MVLPFTVLQSKEQEAQVNRVKDPADPRRCQGAAPDGQCMNEAESGSDFCRAHGGHSTAEAQEKRLYLLTKAKHRERLAQLSEHEEIKSLRDEIAIARMLIEERFNAIKNDSDLLAAFGPINTSLLTVERLVKSAHQIEQNLGNLLAKTSVLALGQSISRILIDELEDLPDYEEIVDRINERIITTIASAGNPTE
ncbi:MAG: hypothetical protein DWQ35_23145 [Planctomycetota bacterium]|nr:MAG: hypothetical protein DWQ35_23145 [Planctomycetota bacterium]REK23303.1 MAG: hypothetical protein DWQ42_15585 [Planctomycetota bacterium]REK39213.1 MAG: hypothetical protein DWQ46_18175 [Planctomycetota bacterium]